MIERLLMELDEKIEIVVRGWTAALESGLAWPVWGRLRIESREGTWRAKVRKERIQAQSTEALSQKLPGMFEEQKGGGLLGRREWEGVCREKAAKVRSSDLLLRIIKMIGRYDLNRCATTNKQINEWTDKRTNEWMNK